MARYRESLPQRTGVVVVTDCGLETTLIFPSAARALHDDVASTEGTGASSAVNNAASLRSSSAPTAVISGMPKLEKTALGWSTTNFV